ncbi:hypothetical protein DYB38_013095 [Aphanomyces astaci]|uniref:Uncharacterized protein n=1 Tax=Aphanomyces astaci TaxID=112090 RepID=A0A397BZT9_APHAT|nr:hypothetical protein DYB38_013095 [Aphanomyces astaci]
MHQLRRHLHAAHGLNVWYATAMGLCGCLGLLLLGFISYWCFKLRQDSRRPLYMGKNRSKRMYLLGRATSSLAQLTSRGRLGGGGESKHVLCSLFPTTAAAMQAEDLSALRAFFHYVQEQCPHVLPVLGIHLMPSTDKVMVLTPYVHDVFGAIFQSTASTGPPPTIESLLSLPLFRKHALQRDNRPSFARRDQMLKTVDGVVGKQLPRDAVARSRSQDGALPIVLQVA